MNQKNIFIGKEILRLITIAMYDDPLNLYREYIQNSVDATDSVEETSIAKIDAAVHINLDYINRTIVIRDNGPGVPAKKFTDLMKSIGWSEKNKTSLRGIWGIGRLAGLAYCEHLIFRTKTQDENSISRIDWDGRKFRTLLSELDDNVDLATVLEQISTISSEKAEIGQSSFFEVQIKQVIRHGNDVLLNDNAVETYLSQVAPVPFHSDAPFRNQLTTFLNSHIDVSGHHIFLNDRSEPIYKPHRSKFVYAATNEDCFSDVEFFEITNNRENPVAVGWILHHSYFGAIKNNPMIRGLRARSGNMQIGNERILSGIFPEERFNNWSVGELHILGSTLRPNGQRSSFEDTSAFRDLKNKLTSIVGRTIAKKCRENSAARNKFRLVLGRLQAIEASIDTLVLGILSSEKTNAILVDIEQEISSYQSELAAFPVLSQKKISAITSKIIVRVRKFQRANSVSPDLNRSPDAQLDLIRNIADLIYDHAPNHTVSNKLIRQVQSFIKHK